MTVHVRWPAKNSGPPQADDFFWSFLHQGKKNIKDSLRQAKERKKIYFLSNDL
jgi:hypothetical protein